MKYQYLKVQKIVIDYQYNDCGDKNVSKREFAGWFKAFFSMAFYVGLFSGIGYLIQITLF